MPLTLHQRKHVQALLADASSPRGDVKYDAALQASVIDFANRLLDGTDDWPDRDLRPSEIHGWFEVQKDRDNLENNVLPGRR